MSNEKVEAIVAFRAGCDTFEQRCLILEMVEQFVAPPLSPDVEAAVERLEHELRERWKGKKVYFQGGMVEACITLLRAVRAQQTTGGMFKMPGGIEVADSMVEPWAAMLQENYERMEKAMKWWRNHARAPRTDEYREFGGLSKQAISDRLDFAHNLGFGRKGHEAHEILTKFRAPRLTGEWEILDAMRYVWLLANMGLVWTAAESWNPQWDKPMLLHLQDFIDAGLKKASPKWLEGQRDLLHLRAAFARDLGEVEG